MAIHRQRLPDDAVLIIGAGLAGLYLALNLKPRKAVVLAAKPVSEGAASAWAQGGVAAALAAGDSPQAHAADTVRVGAGLVDPAIAQMIAEDGPGLVRNLASLGVPFDRDSAGEFVLSREAAHSAARVARVSGDLAGKSIMEVLVARAKAADWIELTEGKALDLLTDGNGEIAGVLAATEDGLTEFTAGEVVIASGGVGGPYAVTTNPPSSRGDGLAMAARAGAVIGEAEFVQFHPTAMDIGRDPAPLATEALRGDGALLVDAYGARLVDHPEGELAPRDIVARAVHRAKAAGRQPYLDARAAIGEAFPDRFPTVFSACMSAGIDPRRNLIPVAPAAHYHMGGVRVDAHGAASLPGLLVCGEAACTGAHGGNRLASNSLLEAIVFARRIAERLKDSDAVSRTAQSAEVPPRLPRVDLAQLREAMARHAGVERTASGLAGLLDEINAMEARTGGANPLIAARLIAASALMREESRGAHARADHPETHAEARRSAMTLAEARNAAARAA